MGYGDMFSEGFFVTLFALAAAGVLALIAGAAWLLWWLFTHVAWVA